MRRFIFDRHGEVSYYLTGAGLFYDASNRAVAWLQDDAVVNPQGEHLGWFDGSFLRDKDGFLLGFVKGSRVGEEGFSLPPTKPLNFTPEPVPAPFFPIYISAEKPTFTWVWSGQSLAQAATSYLT